MKQGKGQGVCSGVAVGKVFIYKKNRKIELVRKTDMNMDERITRINELYHKSQAEGLTEEEKTEQAKLRAEYIASVRGNLRAQLDSVTIQNPDGTLVNLGEKFGNKKTH